MNVSSMLGELCRLLNYNATPAAPVKARLMDFLNCGHRDYLSKPGMAFLRDGATTLTTVAGQALYALPPIVARINAITDRTSQRRLQYLPLDQLRRLDPGLTGNGTPDYWYPISGQAVQTQPSAATGLWAVSTDNTDTQTVSVEGVLTGGYPVATTATMTGTTRAQVGALATWTEVTKFYLSAVAKGSVSLYDAAVNGTELARLEPGNTYGKFFCVGFYPTPVSAVTYFLDYTRRVPDLVSDTDEPILPEDFHNLIVKSAQVAEYQYLNDDRYGQASREEVERFKELRAWLLFPPDWDGRPGRRPVDQSNLGPFFPRGVW